MANQLKMAQVRSILTLHEQGWSYRRIARALGIQRETVKRYVQLERVGSEPGVGEGQNWPNPPTASGLAQSLDVCLQEAAGNGLTHAEFLELAL